MISKYAFKMIVFVGTIKYTGYYVHNNGRQYKMVGMIREGYLTGINYLLHSQRSALEHMEKSLSYDALITRARRAKTYSVERVLVSDIQDELDTLEQELVLSLI